MKKFLVLYIAPSSVLEEWAKTPEAERKAAESKMQSDWQEWGKKNAKHIVETAGAGKTMRVNKEGTKETKNDIMLYSLVEAESAEEAAKMFENHPHLGIPQASIEIMPANVLPGMMEKM